MKQVIIIRKDLNMRKGKMVAQGAHASMAVFFNRINHYNRLENILEILIDANEYDNWIKGLFTKICVSVDSVEELKSLYTKAVLADIPCALITDSGLTEFNGVATETAVAIGPGNDDEIDKITGHLKLL